jgi:hypothetical protein
VDRFCANEADQRFIRHLATFPDLLKARPGLETFVWGHEIDLHDAGPRRWQWLRRPIASTSCRTNVGELASEITEKLAFC